MAKPITVANVFETQTGPIPLAQLDTNFSTAYAAVNDFATYSNYLVDSSGAANTITVTTPVNTTFSYSTGVQLQVQVANTTTAAAPQINVDGLGAQTIVNAAGGALVSGAIQAGQIVILQYDGVNFRLLTGQGSGANSFSSLTVGAPASGVALSVTGVSGSTAANFVAGGVFQAATFNGSATNKCRVDWVDNQSTGHTWSVIAGQSAAGSFDLFDATNGATRLSINSAGNVTINAPSSGNAFTAVGVASANAATITGSSSAGSSLGLYVNAGTNASDRAVLVQNQAATANYFLISGDGGVSVGAPTGGDQGLGTLNIQNGLYVAGSQLYVGAPINQKSANYTAILSDANKTLMSGGSTPFTFTIPANASVAFAPGTMITFINIPGGPATVSIAITTDTLFWSPSGASGTRTLAVGGVATAIKLTSTSWILSGTGLS